MRVNRIAAVLAACAFAPAAAAQAATFNVNTTADNAVGCAPNTGPCSLRGAIIASNASVGSDVISVPAGTYKLTLAATGTTGVAGESDNVNAPGGIGNGVGPNAAVGDLDIFGTVTINGLGPDLTIVDANQIDRVFAVYGGSEGGGYDGHATISGLTMTGGHVVGNANHGGGGIQTRDNGTSILTNVVIKGNSIVNAPGDRRGGMFGGGVENVEDNATTTIDHSVITGNTVTADGTDSPVITGDPYNGASRDPRGGGVIAGSGAVTVTDSQISNNIVNTTGAGTTSATGGGVASAGGAIVLNRVSITGNQANASTPYGGAIGMVGKTHQPSAYAGMPPAFTTNFADGVHSTFTGTNVTISGNSASMGHTGGVFFGPAVDATFNLSTISGNTTPTGSSQISVQSNGTGTDTGLPAVADDMPYDDRSSLALNRSVIDNVGSGACDLPPGMNTEGQAVPAAASSGTLNWIVGNTCGGATAQGKAAGSANLAVALTGLYGQALAPNAGSPLLDQAGATCTETKDGRGFTRPQGAGCDIGAGERQPAPTATSTPLLTGTVAVGQTLTVDESTFNAAASITTKWQRCQGAACTDIAGQATRQYVIATGDVGFSLRAVRTAIGSDDTSPVSSVSDQTTVVPAVTTPPPPPVATLTITKIKTVCLRRKRAGKVIPCQAAVRFTVNRASTVSIQLKKIGAKRARWIVVKVKKAGTFTVAIPATISGTHTLPGTYSAVVRVSLKGFKAPKATTLTLRVRS